ncbi:MAG: nitrite reductase, copper-containing [Anaerolineae bacterium]|nr:nitrite reductase, copper-containing [Anaerolineae bacterium]
MNKPVSPNIVALVLIALAAAFLMLFPISIQIAPVASNAQAATATTGMAMTMHTAAAQTKTVEYTLKTVIGLTPPMAFIGVGGDIDGVINPPLSANVGDTVRITVINGDPVMHDLKIDEFNVFTGELVAKDEQKTVEFIPNRPGDFVYYCNQPGHRQIGMFGTLTITGEAAAEVASAAPEAQIVAAVPTVAPAAADAVSIVRNPADLPAPVGDREATNIRVDLTAIEVNGILADGTTFRYFTFDGAVPGPMIRVRVGDTIDLHVHNDTTSVMMHSIDLHAVTGPGGGAVYTQTMPGEETSFTFKALAPGVFVYHCATPSVAEHIANGMFGLIVVEPEGGLPPVDREFYVMQSEVYTVEPFGTKGDLTFDYQAMLDEQPQYYVFNGAANALTSDENALRASVGETVRIFFGVGGPNKTSSFHVIGEIFDRVYELASLTSPPLTNVQTTLVPPGGATMVEFGVEVPGRYILVDHALSRMERGLAGYLYVDGADQPDIFHGDELTPGSGH